LGLHRFAVTQRLPVPLEGAWHFFVDPRNLAVITPPDMGFEITGDPPDQMYAGMLVAYRVRPIFGLPVTWLTEITQLHEGRMFVDEQRRGPYRFWHHQHHFREIAGGIEMQDIVHYDVGFGPIGDVVNAVAVRRRLRQIFAFRRGVLQQRFGALEGYRVMGL
jgi:ligand-binding SRPBCC domain-containing protein